MAISYLRPSVLYGRVGNYLLSGKIAAFDLDGTLVGSIREQFTLADHILEKLRELSRTHELVIFSNQAPPHPLDLPQRFGALLAIFEKERIPISAFLALQKDNFRKPEIGMWVLFSQLYNTALSEGVQPMEISDAKAPSQILEVSYTGDAAGRQGPFYFDHSNSDAEFATNLNNWRWLQLLVAEAQKKQLVVAPPASKITFFTPEVRFPFDFQQLASYDLVLLIGYPASGKSTLAHRLQEELKFTVVSRDDPEYKTMVRCAKATKALLEQGKKVVIDNLNTTREARSTFLDLVRTSSTQFKQRHSAAALDMNVPMLEAMTRNGRREKPVANVVIYTFRKNYQPPTTEEGFTKVFYLR